MAELRSARKVFKMEVIELPRNRCSVLSLVLNGKWYDMIASGKKREEYRDREVWNKRITKWLHRFNQTHEITHLVVAFQRGYSKPSMWFEVEWVCSEKVIRIKHPEWGEPADSHFIIKLGGPVTLKDVPQEPPK